MSHSAARVADPLPAGFRDLADYADRYQDLPFEPTQVQLRRRRVLAQVRNRPPRRLLEVGCGELPLFVDLPGTEVTVVEPAESFAATARRLAAARTGVTVVQALLEDVDATRAPGPFDVVVVSSLLHEVPDPQQLLAAVRRFCGRDTLVHVNVPNALSLHRRLGVAMDMIADESATSPTQRLLQHSRVYDPSSLLAELRRAGFTARASGSFFVKPFPHAMMQQLLDGGFLTPALLDGLDRLAELLPDLGSEIWVDAEVSGD